MSQTLKRYGNTIKTEERGILSEVKEMFFWWIYPLIGLGFALLPLLIVLFVFKSL